MSLKIRRALYGTVSQEVVEVLLRLGGLCVSESLHDNATTLLFECLSLQIELYSSSALDNTGTSALSPPGDVVLFSITDSAGASVKLSLCLRDAQPLVAETVNLIACNFKEKER
jgi:hypothetical protein